MYATVDDLEDWIDIQDDEKDRAENWIRRAGMVVDSWTRGARFDVDDHGTPTDQSVRDAFRDAVCAQVAWWWPTEDPTGFESQWSSMSAGPVSLSRASSEDADSGRYSVEAFDILNAAGLIGNAPSQA